MKKQLFLFAILVFIASSTFGQKKFEVTEKDMSGVIFREAGDNETMVEIQSNVPLDIFESSMDKNVNVFGAYTESGFYFYILKFPTGKKFKGRQLTIKAHGFMHYDHLLDLQAKVPVGLLIIDPDGDLVGCYYEHLSKGNTFFRTTQYADAKTEYEVALKCSDTVPNHDLSSKIKIAKDCQYIKITADNFYKAGKFIEAKQEYEKLYMLNPNDPYSMERIATCEKQILNMPRTFKIKATDVNGKRLSDVIIKAGTLKTDKEGKVVYKNGKPKEHKFKQISASKNAQGDYIITVTMANKILKFTKYIDGKTEYFSAVAIPANSDYIEVKLSIRKTAGGWIGGVEDVLKGI